MKKTLLALLASVVAMGGLVNFSASFNEQHIVPVWVSHPFAMLAFAYLLFQHIFPFFIYRGPTAAIAPVAQQIQASGTCTLSILCGGEVGTVKFRGPLIRAQVYPLGVLLKLPLMPACPILKHELNSIRTHRSFGATMIEIKHTSKHVATPVRLIPIDEQMLRAALETLIEPHPHGTKNAG